MMIALAAAGFARLGTSVRVLGRDELRAQEAARLTRQRAGGNVGGAMDVRAVACDVSSLADLRRFIAAFTEHEDRLHVLVTTQVWCPQNEHTRLTASN